MTDIPPFVVPLLSALLGAGGASGILIAVIKHRPEIISAQTAANVATVKEWKDLYVETQRGVATLRSEGEKIRSSYYGLLGAFVELRNHARTEVAGISVALDQKEYDRAAAQLEALGRYVASVRLPSEPS